ncbi:hypothetical protein [Desulfobulbus elongatus]|nr:hypothetical protein [Desulfobulbus elongatus]
MTQEIRQVVDKGGGVQGRVKKKGGKTNAPTADRWGALLKPGFSTG